VEATNLAAENQGTNKKIAHVFGAIVVFAALARGAHDIWAATLVYISVLLVAVVFWVRSARSVAPPVRFPLWSPLLSLCAALSVSFWFSSNPSESFLGLMDMYTAVVVLLISANVFSRPETFAVLLGWLVPCLWFESVLVLVSVVASRNVTAFTSVIASHPLLVYFLRIPEIFDVAKMGSLINANLLSVFVLPLTLLLGLRVAEQWRRTKTVAWFWASGLLSALICLALARSLSALLALLLAGAVIGLLRHRAWQRADKKYVYAICGLVVAVMAALLIYKFSHAVDHAVDPRRDNSNRLYWWLSALRMFADFPWSGVGVGNFPSAYLSYRVGGTENTLYAHGALFTILAETGLIGLAAFAALALALVRSLRSRVTGSSPQMSYALALLAMGFFCAFNIGIEYLVNLLLIALLLGALLSNVAAPQIKPRVSAIMVAALGVGAVPFLASPFFSSRLSTSAYAALQADDLTTAQRQFQDAVALDARAWEPYVGLARIAAKCGAADQAVMWQQKAWERNRLSRPLRQELESYQRLLR
jgi:O-antigen ligase